MISAPRVRTSHPNTSNWAGHTQPSNGYVSTWAGPARASTMYLYACGLYTPYRYIFVFSISMFEVFDHFDSFAFFFVIFGFFFPFCKFLVIFLYFPTCSVGRTTCQVLDFHVWRLRVHGGQARASQGLRLLGKCHPCVESLQVPCVKLCNRSTCSVSYTHLTLPTKA